MIQPFEMKGTRPMELHDGVVSTTTDVWNMLVASRDGDLGRVQELASGCPALLTCQYDYTTPLHFAVCKGHLELVRYLVGQGALDPTYLTHPFRDSLVTMAEDRGYDEIAQFLKQSLDDDYCSTPLGYAARWGWQEMIALLLDRGADVNKAGAPWATPLAWARKKGRAAIEAALRQAGAQ